MGVGRFLLQIDVLRLLPSALPKHVLYFFFSLPLPLYSLKIPSYFPLGCPRAPALGTLLHAANMPWSSNLHMLMSTFQ